MSDIGGQLGLWVGISILSLAEVVELVILLLAACLGTRNRTENTDKVDKS